MRVFSVEVRAGVGDRGRSVRFATLLEELVRRPRRMPIRLRGPLASGHTSAAAEDSPAAKFSRARELFFLPSDRDGSRSYAIASSIHPVTEWSEVQDRMSRRSATETISALFLAFLERTSWTQAELARRLEISVRVVRTRLEELERQGMKIEREEEHPHVVWTVPYGWYPDGLTLDRTTIVSLLRLLARTSSGCSG